jgi:pyroglutamyl-peptidase
MPPTDSTVLLTGFEPYGGRGINPAADVARRLDGQRIGAARVAARVLPVAFEGLRAHLREAIKALRPCAVVALGLYPGEPMIRLERVGLNLADFEIADNAGLRITGAAVEAGGAPARFATLPLGAIQRRLLEAGIPARPSTSAGTFLCNAALYASLELLHALGHDVPCGFVHLPYLPRQVALLVAELQEARAQSAPGRSEGLGQRADLASMALATQVEAVRIVIETTLAHTG